MSLSKHVFVAVGNPESVPDRWQRTLRFLSKNTEILGCHAQLYLTETRKPVVIAATFRQQLK
jgi:hypothetical protein